MELETDFRKETSMSQQARAISLEKYGLEQVPIQAKKTTWFDFFILQVAFSVNSGNFIVPALAVLNGKLPLLPAILSSFSGAALAFLFVSFLTIPGSRYGLPSQYAIRSIIGSMLSRYIASPIRTITSLYWFAVQTIGGSLVFMKLVETLFGVKLPLLSISITFSILMSVLALIGFDAVKKAIRSFLPILILGQIILLYLLIKELNWTSISNVENSHNNWSYYSFFFYSSLAFVQYISGVSASSDMARFARSEQAGFWGLYLGNVVGFFVTAVLGVLSATIFKDWNPFSSILVLTESKFIIFLILLCSMASMISINLNNAYTGGFSLLNTFQTIGRIKSAIIFGCLALLISCFPVVINQAQKYISFLGILIIPISATIISDFLLIKKCRIDEKDLVCLLKQSKWNSSALISIFFGALCYLFLPDRWSPGFLTFLSTVLFYVLTFKWINRKTG
jgi:purine-cytosine permease-like protein